MPGPFEANSNELGQSIEMFRLVGRKIRIRVSLDFDMARLKELHFLGIQATKRRIKSRPRTRPENIMQLLAPISIIFWIILWPFIRSPTNPKDIYQELEELSELTLLGGTDGLVTIYASNGVVARTAVYTTYRSTDSDWQNLRTVLHLVKFFFIPSYSRLSLGLPLTEAKFTPEPNPCLERLKFEYEPSNGADEFIPRMLLGGVLVMEFTEETTVVAEFSPKDKILSSYVISDAVGEPFLSCRVEVLQPD